MKELLSVIIPVHNVENYLEDCVESIIKQTYTELDIILIDDGSTDSSWEICKRYTDIDNRIRCEHFDRSLGAVRARQRGIELARGNYVTYVDSDDWMDLDAFYKMMDTALKNDADIVISTGRIHEFPDSKLVMNDNAKAGIYVGNEIDELCKKMLINGPELWPTLVNRVYKKDKHIEYQLMLDERIKVNNDVACTTMTVLNADRVVVINECFYHYRKNNQSITNTWRSDYIESKCYMYQSIRKEMIKNDKKYLLDVLNTHFLNKLFMDIRIECSRSNKKSILWKIRRLKNLYNNEIISEFLKNNISFALEGENEDIWKVFKKRHPLSLFVYIKFGAVRRMLVRA